MTIFSAMSFEIMALLKEINNLGTTVLVVTHAQDLVELFGERVIAIDEGLVVRDSGLEFDGVDAMDLEEEVGEEEFDHEAE